MKKKPLPSLEFIRDFSLIEEMHSDLENGKLTITIKNKNHTGQDTRIGDVLHNLPQGFCNKCETGFGATTSEIKANRNSIIVEPVKQIALSKQEKHGGFYYGLKPGMSRDSKKEKKLQDYLRNTSSPKKIFCVADRLGEVVEIIESEEFRNLEFHLFVDEIDSVQLGSTYREVMNLVMDIYKSFPEERRTAVTATFLEFSDPELAEEPLIVLRYSIPSTREVHLVYTNDIEMEITTRILNTLREDPQNKIVVPVNSFDAIDRIIHRVTTMTRLIEEIDIKVLASDNIPPTLEKFRGTVSNGILPGRLTFSTSAFFTGYDFEESYHLIVPASSQKDAFCLSLNQFLQIAGRCRRWLLSQILVLKKKAHKRPYRADKTQLIQDAEAQLDLIKQANLILGNSNTLKGQIKKIQKDVANLYSSGEAPLLYEAKDGEFKTSYLTVDALLEKSRVQQQLYSTVDGMEKAMVNRGWKVTTEETNHTNVPKVTLVDLTLDKELRKISQNLWEAAKNGHPVLQEYTNQTHLEKLVFEVYNQYYSFFDTAFLSRIIESTFRSKKMNPTNRSGITKQMNTLKTRLWFATLDPTNLLRINIEANLKPGQIYERAKLEELVLNAHRSLGIKDVDWLKFIRAIFKVSDVKKNPTALKLLSWHIPFEKVRYPRVRTLIDN